VGEQVRSGLRLAGWILLALAVVGVTLLSEKTLLDRSAPKLHRTAGACGLILVAILMFVSVERWGKWFVGALGYWIVKSVFTLPFRPSVMLLQYLLLFIFAFALCARWAQLERQCGPQSLKRSSIAQILVIPQQRNEEA